jgi:hypothetical protein
MLSDVWSYIHGHICRLSGDLTVSGPLGQDPIKSEYTLSIEAMDRGSPPLYGATTVVITIPVNHAPEIKGPITFSVTEDHPIGMLVGIVDAIDADDLQRIEKLNFTINDEEGKFVIYINFFTITIGKQTQTVQ